PTAAGQILIGSENRFLVLGAGNLQAIIALKFRIGNVERQFFARRLLASEIDHPGRPGPAIAALALALAQVRRQRDILTGNLYRAPHFHRGNIWPVISQPRIGKEMHAEIAIPARRVMKTVNVDLLAVEYEMDEVLLVELQLAPVLAVIASFE